MKNLGFGFMRLPLTDENRPETIDHEHVEKMVDLFMNEGYTYYDTGYPYHNQKSEEAIRKNVTEKYPRDSIIIADKLPLRSITKEEQLDEIFNEQLERCGVDYFDYYLSHNISPFSESGFIDVDSYTFLKQKKAEGKIKKLGFSTHADAQYIENYLQKHPDMEFIQLQLNYLDWESESIQSRKCYEVARRHDLDIIVMEPLKGGFLANIPQEAQNLIKEYDPTLTPVELAFKFVANLDGVIMVLTGASNYNQIKENIEIFNNMTALTSQEKELIEKIKDVINDKIAVPCTKCNYCINDCPISINIPYLFELYNGSKLLNVEGFNTYQLMYINYSKGEGNGLAANCIKCGKCVENCPQHIDIPAIMQDVTPELEAKF